MQLIYIHVFFLLLFRAHKDRQASQGMFALKQRISFQCPEDPLCFKVDTAFCLLQKVLLERFWVGNLTDVLANFTKILAAKRLGKMHAVSLFDEEKPGYTLLICGKLVSEGWLKEFRQNVILSNTLLHERQNIFHIHNGFDNFFHLEGFFENNYIPGYF